MFLKKEKSVVNGFFWEIYYFCKKKDATAL